MHRLAWIVIVAVACGGKKDKPPEGSGSSEVAKPKEPDKPKSGSARSLGDLTTSGSGSAKVGDRPANEVAPKPVLKPVAGECTWRNQDVALIAVCDYRCSVDDREACALAAQMYFGGEGVKADRAKALELATRSCTLESGFGCMMEGAMKNESAAFAAKALPFYERDCAAELPAACIELAIMLKSAGDKRAPAELKKGLEIRRKACEGGDGTQCAQLAVAHNNGAGVPKDVVYAAELRKKACELGHATTCFELSSETSKDDKRSALVEKACTLGLRKACAKLALELAGKNTMRMIEINQRACDLGDGGSCVRIGEDFMKQTKREKALETFTRACKLGDEHGCAQARALGAK